MTITDPRTAKLDTASKVDALSGSDSLNGQRSHESHEALAVEGQTSPQARQSATTMRRSPAGSTTAPPAIDDPPPNPVALERRKTSQDHDLREDHNFRVLADDIPGRQERHDAHLSLAAGEQNPPAQVNVPAASNGPTPGLADPLLALAADVLDDLERVRIANENRLRQLTRNQADSDGIDRGFGLDQSHPDVARLAALVDLLIEAEHKAQLNLERTMRTHALGPWVKATKGVGEKQGARLIAAIGDPYWNTLHDRPRRVSELWSYCGYGDAREQVRKRGQKANWSATAKMRAYLVAEKCMQTGKASNTPYYQLYAATKAKYADATHDGDCVRCGPSGNPAKSGSALSDGHKHARALRAVAKEILRDLWREARTIHERGIE